MDALKDCGVACGKLFSSFLTRRKLMRADVNAADV